MWVIFGMAQEEGEVEVGVEGVGVMLEVFWEDGVGITIGGMWV